MHLETITELLNLPEVKVFQVIESTDDAIYLLVEPVDSAKPAVCSHCGMVHTAVHSKGWVLVEDQPILNTSILIAAGGSAIIPVSCTEQGRWNYASREFSDSGVMMSRSIRTNKSASVSESVRSNSSYGSDQSGVWRDIEALHQSHGTSSNTGAMKDAYESRREQTESYKGHFPCQEGQCGMAVLIKGRVAGIEFLSRPDAYQQLHEKLLGSYVMDIPMAQAGKSGPDPIKVQKILDRIKEGTEERFKSVGLGEDCRYTIRGLVGSALLVDNWYLHGAFFRTNRRDQENSSNQERMSSMRQRRAYRQ